MTLDQVERYGKYVAKKLLVTRHQSFTGKYLMYYMPHINLSKNRLCHKILKVY